MRTRAIIVLAFVTLVTANSNRKDDTLEHLEETLTRAMDQLNGKDTIGLYGNIVTLEKTAENGESTEKSADPLVNRVEKFLRTRKLQITLPDDTSTAGLFGRALGQRNIDIELRSLTHGTSEARTKLKKMLMPLMLLLNLKAVIILPIVITIIGLVGMKGLGIGLMSLFVSGAIALKALLTPPPSPRVSYGVVRPHEIHHDHWHRSEQEVNQPYRGWTPEYGEQYAYHDIA